MVSLCASTPIEKMPPSGYWLDKQADGDGWNQNQALNFPGIQTWFFVIALP
jgi:hypothetical protein